MGGFQVDPEEMRGHAADLLRVHERFAAVKDASAHITRADEAYGKLCSFLPPVLEGRHTEQDAAVGELAENIELLAQALKETADQYEEADAAAADALAELHADLL
ncbi:hypothetical protein GCM10009853_029840 [Glycomyces scopariae]|uniref:Excreted virulence factor EspC, type VII ESX diderm n=1 Tax=Glycomyces sambucus TaxID=380244 RepID=A0A1G9FYI1_9ACTN|nr:type VII secretion target [Glycomyces sambucus]SDK93365.1 Excreted virulence factor EspC, type VII ESX diderm [Glycomyces sambucus]